MNKKLIIIVVIALVAVAGVYKFVLAKPADSKAAEPAKAHVEGTPYVLGKEFLVNLADNRYAKLTVALVIDEEKQAEIDKAHPPVVSEEKVTLPDGFGSMAQEAVVRDIITDELTDASAEDLTSGEGRESEKKKILKALQKGTDVAVTEVLFTDVTVQ